MADLSTLLSKFLTNLYAGTLQVVTSITYALGTTLTEAASGKLTLTGTTPMIQWGGTSSSFPAIARGTVVTTGVDFVRADNGAGASVGVSGIRIGSTNFLLFDTAPTIASGFGGTPTVPSNNGTACFLVNVGTGGAATSGVITLPAASTGWALFCVDITAAAGHTGLRTVQTASTTTSATIESQNSAGAATAWASASIVRIIAMAY